MKVRELIKLLQEFPAESEVVTLLGHDDIGREEWGVPQVCEEDEEHRPVPVGTVEVFSLKAV